MHSCCKSCVNLEHLVLGTELRSVPWLSKEHGSPNSKAALHAFDRACAVQALSAKVCSITPVRGNPDFPPGLSKTYLAAEWPYTEMQVKHFFCRGRFMRHRELAELSNTNLFPLWLDIQMKHYLDNPSHKESYTKAPTAFESLCSRSFSQSQLDVICLNV